MKYIVLDMEWNRPVSRNAMIKHPIKLKGEIIQIGAVMLDENLEEIDNFDVMICPKFYKRMHKEVEALTEYTFDSLCDIIHDEKKTLINLIEKQD